MRLRAAVLAFATALALAPSGPARAILLGLDPASQTVGIGDPVQVDLNVSGLGDLSAPSLGAWDVDVGFDPTILGFTGATFSTELDLFGFGSLNGAFDLGGVVDIFEVSLDLPSDLDSLQTGAFTLATLSFDALAAGVSALSLSVDDLGDSLGDRLVADQVSGASVTVTAPVTVPEPGTLALFGLGLVGLAALRRRRA